MNAVVMNTIVFIRHGETDMAGSFCGHSNPELNATGEGQVIRLAEEVAMLGVERIYSSDLRRASQTATALAHCSGVGVDYLPALREIDFGLWEGLLWQEIEDRFPQEAARWIREYPLRSAPGGEAYRVFTARVDAVITSLLEVAAEKTIAIVTHRGVMRYALTRFFEISDEDACARTSSYGSMVIAKPRREGEKS
jgi:alpha-ribazole phosphatase/probable phosphoglycerate mutase